MDSTEQVIEKIKRCIRLAKRAGTDGERAAAEAAAKRLADANGLKLEEIGDAGENVSKARIEETDWTYRRTGAEIAFIIQTIRTHFGVHILQTRRRGCSRMSLTLFGVAMNIEIAKYVYDILLREFYRAWREAKGWGLDKRSFMTGWFMQINQKLTEHPLRNDTEVFEAEKKAAADKYDEYKSQNQDIKQRKTSGSQKDAEAVYRGFRSAERISLNRPCEGSASGTASLGNVLRLK